MIYRKLLFIAGFFISLQAAQAQEVKWLQWNEGYPVAVKQKKIILVDTYTDWCGWCKRMDRDTYTNPDIVKKLKESFVTIKFNPELANLTYKIDSQEFSANEFYQQLHRGDPSGFPTTYFINPERRQIIPIPGYQGPQAFLDILNQVVEGAKK